MSFFGGVFAWKDKRRKVVDAPLHATNKNQNKKVGKLYTASFTVLGRNSILLCYALSALFFDSCTIHHDCVLPPSGIFCLNIYLEHALLSANHGHKNWAACGQCARTFPPDEGNDVPRTFTERGRPMYTFGLIERVKAEV